MRHKEDQFRVSQNCDANAALMERRGLRFTYYAFSCPQLLLCSVSGHTDPSFPSCRSTLRPEGGLHDNRHRALHSNPPRYTCRLTSKLLQFPSKSSIALLILQRLDLGDVSAVHHHKLGRCSHICSTALCNTFHISHLEAQSEVVKREAHGVTATGCAGAKTRPLLI